MKNKFFFPAIIFLMMCVDPLHSQWVRSGALEGGNVSCLAINGTNLFAGSLSGGVYVSTNNGASWAAANDGLTNLTVRALTASGSNLFAATYGGVFLSTNNGTSWTAVNTGLTNVSVVSVTAIGSKLFAGTAGGFFVSSNNGTGWAVTGPMPVNTAVWAMVASGANLIAGTNSGIYTSSDGGITWIPSNSGSINVRCLVVNGANIFAGTTSGGVFLSSDNGVNWTAVNVGIANLTVQALVASGTNLFAGTGAGVSLSTDNGATWTTVNSGLTNTSVGALVISGTNTYAGTQGGVFLSTNNGASWTAKNAGLTNMTVGSLAVVGSSLFAGSSTLFQSTNSGASWTPTALTNTNVMALVVIGTNLFAGTAGHGVCLSTNNGTSWNEVNTGLPASAVISSLVATGTNLFAAGQSGLFLSANNGANWTPVMSGLSSTVVVAVGLSGSNLVASTTAGVFLSTNNGSSWIPTTGLENKTVTSFGASGTNLLAGTSSGLFLSTDGGKSWSPAGVGLPDLVVTAFVASGSSLFAGAGGGVPGSGGGVFVSADGGTTWVAANSGLPNARMIAFVVIGTNLFVATTGNGVWRRPLSEMIVSQQFVITATAGTGGSIAPSGSVEVTSGGSQLFTITPQQNCKITDVLVDGISVGSQPTYTFADVSGNHTIAALFAPKTMKDRYDEITQFLLSLPGSAFKGPADVRRARLIDAVTRSYDFQNAGKLKSAANQLEENVINHLTPQGNAGQNLWVIDETARQAVLGMLEEILGFLQGPRSNSEVAQEFGLPEISEVQIPTGYGLAQNYPNPFNPSTIVQFALPKASHVTLKVFNLLGKEVATLVSQELGPGYFSVRWQADVPSGTYIYRFQAGEFVQTKKMILLH